MSRLDSPGSHRKFDLPVWLLAAWIAVMGTLYVRAMAAERGRAMLAPIIAVAGNLGLTSR
jgi:hypothetical protein